ncbi:GNAT family N-acetyltransferase [Paraburkholderia sp. UCT31]|uniref:GNAT family N-acetyltransferase n=1 Tax=Paraburkholderia sp. UCT31 TaxID=2615209 RepID=UPI00165551EE|nr:GNAT family N-acetyltransferase [Paraburkholderia sp. UCT31]MBC8737189.1 GNAT family N-acetyltransferase [Paraburkholderia sp. UCT31]
MKGERGSDVVNTPLKTIEREMGHSLKHFYDAVRRITLKHAISPDALGLHRSVSAGVGCQAGAESEFEIMAPCLCDVPPSELKELFEADRHARPAPRFSHDVFSSDEAISPVDLYAEDLRVPSFDEFSTGMRVAPNAAHYCIVAADEAQDIVGFAQFQLHLAPSCAAWSEVTDHQAAARIILRVALDSIYVLKKHRGHGAATAMLTFASDVFAEELVCIGPQVTSEMGVAPQLELIPQLESEWASLTGKLAHHIFGRLLRSRAETFMLSGDRRLMVHELQEAAGY